MDDFTGNTIAASIAHITRTRPMSHYEAAIALSTLGPREPGDLPSLIEALRSPSTWTRWWAINTLKARGPGARCAIPELAQVLEDRNPWILWAAAEALKAIADIDVPIADLTEALADEDGVVRHMASATLRRRSKKATTRIVAKIKLAEFRVSDKAKRPRRRSNPRISRSSARGLQRGCKET